MEGTCPECGLRFEWADAFDSQRKRLRWLFEHKRPWSPGLIRAWCTWWMAMIPPRFWLRVTPAHRTSEIVWRWPLVLAATLLLIGTVARLAAEPYIKWRSVPKLPFGTPQYWNYIGNVAGDFALRPLWFPHGPYLPDEWYWRSIREAWSFPLAVVGSSVVCSLLLLNLRSSRRIAGVSTGHIMRAAVYRLAPLALMYITWLALTLLASNVLDLYRDRYHIAYIVPLACIAWGWWWWRTAIVTGWVMPKARLAANLVGIVDVLVSLVVFALLNHRAIGAILG